MIDSSATVGDSHNARHSSAIELVDKTLRDISKRDLVSSLEMTDLLLDIRLFLITHSDQEVV